MQRVRMIKEKTGYPPVGEYVNLSHVVVEELLQEGVIELLDQPAQDVVAEAPVVEETAVAEQPVETTIEGSEDGALKEQETSTEIGVDASN